MWQCQIGKLGTGSCLFKHGSAGRVAASRETILLIHRAQQAGVPTCHEPSKTYSGRWKGIF
jgi:hypothetical protein